MSYNIGFAPIARKDARILILGSMPSQKSLQQQRYYAHPRNAFWPIICKLLNAPADLSYTKCKRLLIDNHIALWDVLQSGYRPGSLDAAIDSSTITCNDFQHFFKQHMDIRCVFFNGGKAEQLFKRYALKEFLQSEIEYRRLPSTSPAHAALNMSAKLKHWQVIKHYL